MHAYLLYTPGEMLEGEDELTALGYHVHPFLGNNDTSGLRNKVKHIPSLGHSASYLSDGLGYTWCGHVHALRANFATMLETYMDADDITIYGESDCVPASYPPVSADDISCVCREAVSRHPEIGIIRLYRRATTFNEPTWRNHAPLEIVPLKKAARTSSIPFTKYYCQTHALIIRRHVRQTVIDAMRDYYLPIDVLISYLSQIGTVPVWHTSINLMLQRPHSTGKRLADWQRKHSVPAADYWRDKPGLTGKR